MTTTSRTGPAEGGAGSSDVITILADDLSGTQEAVAAAAHLGEFLPGGGAPDAAVVLGTIPSGLAGAEVLGIDLDSREGPAEVAGQRVDEALGRIRESGRGAGTVFHKLDSLLRGPVGEHLKAAAARRPVLFCPALPSLGRTVTGAVVHVNGLPLHRSNLWAVESSDPPRSVAEAVRPAPSAALGLETVRSPDFEARLRAAADDAPLVICDAEEERDLDTLVSAATRLGFDLAGAAGLAAALGRRAAHARAPVRVPASGKGILFVIGTASRTAQAQVEALAADGVAIRSLPDVTLADRGGEDLVLIVPGPTDPRRSAALNRDLVAGVHRIRGDRDLFLTGGQTARSVLDALGTRALRPLCQPEHGVVVALADDGALVATRPGSFGGPDSLTSARHAMRAFRTSTERTLS